MKVDDTGSIPEAELNPHSPLVQINDFDFDDWSPFQDDEEEINEVEEAKDDRTDEKLKETAGEVQAAEKALELFSPGFLKKINAGITISADKVQSGKDQ